VAELIGAPSRDVIFTSCATESNNTAISAALKANPTKRHIVTSQVEHSSVLNFCMALERGGVDRSGGVNPTCPESRVPSSESRYSVTYLLVDREGLLKLADPEAAITDETAVVSLMWANNETGVLFPVERIAEICQSRGVLYHCDAVQAAGKVEIDVRKIPADYLSLTGHKFHAPRHAQPLAIANRLRASRTASCSLRSNSFFGNNSVQ
jgi:cysteine desulfurase